MAKTIFYSLAALVCKILFCHSKIKFISSRLRVISSIYFTWFHCTGTYELNKLTLLPMCGFIAQLVEHRTGIAEVMGLNPAEPWFFQASSFQLLKMENLLRWSHFTFIYYRSTNMNYFIYISQKLICRTQISNGVDRLVPNTTLYRSRLFGLLIFTE